MYILPIYSLKNSYLAMYIILCYLLILTYSPGISNSTRRLIFPLWKFLKRINIAVHGYKNILSVGLEKRTTTLFCRTLSPFLHNYKAVYKIKLCIIFMVTLFGHVLWQILKTLVLSSRMLYFTFCPTGDLEEIESRSE